MSRRSDRVADLLRGELSSLLLDGMRDPRIRLATISTVEVTGDLRLARVKVSVLGEDDDRNGCIEALQHASGFLRTKLASRIKLRHTPELSFELDRGAEYAERITSLLEGGAL
jgi:ribosome-binding factor A